MHENYEDKKSNHCNCFNTSMHFWIDIHFDGEILACNTDEQETWEKEVLDAIQ